MYAASGSGAPPGADSPASAPLLRSAATLRAGRLPFYSADQAGARRSGPQRQVLEACRLAELAQMRVGLSRTAAPSACLLGAS